MDDLTTTVGAVAIAAAAVALVALVLAVVQWRALRRLRAAQTQVLGDYGNRDLIAHSASLQREFEALHAFITDAAARLDRRLDVAETRLDASISKVGLVRYDAYNEMSGRQSTSIVLLDDHDSGVMLSSIHHREQARLYAKQVIAGRGELELSPEEVDAIRLAQQTPTPAGPEAEPAPEPPPAEPQAEPADDQAPRA
ncbi:MAG: DUF4446 family protein [Solirubrobacteraceae bacterium]|nr:DUF4446 family protein [Solirubrobacteraceae bacterium]